VNDGTYGYDPTTGAVVMVCIRPAERESGVKSLAFPITLELLAENI
jgi:hypothetical protein